MYTYSLSTSILFSLNAVKRYNRKKTNSNKANILRNKVLVINGASYESASNEPINILPKKVKYIMGKNIFNMIVRLLESLYMLLVEFILLGYTC